MFRRWIPASFIAVAMVLALAGGAVLAFGGGSDSKKADVFERAAEILGIEANDLHNAHDQAKREAQDEAILGAVEKLAFTGVINQEEADEFSTWIANRPDSAGDFLFDKLTSSLFKATPTNNPPAKFHSFKREHHDGLTTRMAEILGIDVEELASAFESGKQQVEETSKLHLLHNLIDEMLSEEKITSTEADALHGWIDATPEWLLGMDMKTRGMSGFSFFDKGSGEIELLKKFPFGNPEDLLEGRHEFRFEYHGPDRTFKFGPEDLEEGSFHFPHRGENLEELFEHFGGIEELENMDGIRELLKKLRNHELFDYPFENHEPTPEDTANSSTSA